MKHRSEEIGKRRERERERKRNILNSISYSIQVVQFPEDSVIIINHCQHLILYSNPFSFHNDFLWVFRNFQTGRTLFVLSEYSTAGEQFARLFFFHAPDRELKFSLFRCKSFRFGLDLSLGGWEMCESVADIRVGAFHPRITIKIPHDVTKINSRILAVAKSYVI